MGFFASLFYILTACLVFIFLLLVSICVYYPPLLYDLDYLRRVIPIGKAIVEDAKEGKLMVDHFEGRVRDHPHQICILFDNEKFTYLDIDKKANKLANYFLTSKTIQKGDVVAIFMYNEPAYAWSFFGIAKNGATAALLNYNLREKSLIHCIKVCGAKVIICGRDNELVQAMREISVELAALAIHIYVIGSGDDILPDVMSYLDLHIAPMSDSSPPRTLRKDVDFFKDSSVFIFTSGTTGLPKATRMTHRRFLSSTLFSGIFGFCKTDVFYICLPLYHTGGFCLAFNGVIYRGATCAMRKKFSVREYWPDVRKYKANVVHYIGETARYLVKAPRQASDGIYLHQGGVKLALGNGMTMDVWKEFKERFNIGQICEFYASSEGNHAFVNIDRKLGSIGRYIPLFKNMIDVLEIVDCDPLTAEPKRDANGRCISMQKGENGLALFRISQKAPLDGYLGNKELTEKKIINDVKVKGDRYFNTGDLMMMDKDYYIYFKDRLGNTFRWKGENVATTEVELVLMDFKEVKEACVFGVLVEGQSGRAGMAAIVLDECNQKLDGRALYAHLRDNLPSYACPKFIRLKREIEITGTFKHKKINMIDEGFDPNIVSDKLFYMDDKLKTYSTVDDSVYKCILGGGVKL